MEPRIIEIQYRSFMEIIAMTFQSEQIAYFKQEDCNLEDFKKLVSQTQSASDLKFVSSIEKNIPIYDASKLQEQFNDNEMRIALMTEWARIFREQAGVLVIKNAYADTSVIDEATIIFNDIIKQEKQENGQSSDHFASGNNDRIWNSLQKLCEQSPQTHAQYFANAAINTVCESWLGPNYQMTAQINVVHPGGEAQKAHRDYHLGFATPEISAQYPSHVHDLSPVLTLQGGVAHVDMSLESGPTKLLPFSQLYRAGYAAWRKEDFRNYFEEKYVQLPLNKGDALFFSPALFHSAGANTSNDVQRMVNLLQVSSAFGRAMESVDRVKMCKLTYPYLLKNIDSISQEELRSSLAATAEGYSFPTNLDLDPPIGGLAPESQQALMLRALNNKWTTVKFEAALDEQSRKKIA